MQVGREGALKIIYPNFPLKWVMTVTRSGQLWLCLVSLELPEVTYFLQDRSLTTDSWLIRTALPVPWQFKAKHGISWEDGAAGSTSIILLFCPGYGVTESRPDRTQDSGHCSLWQEGFALYGQGGVKSSVWFYYPSSSAVTTEEKGMKNKVYVLDTQMK